MAGFALSIRAIAKRFESVEPVWGVSFNVAAGEIIGVIGPNGAGKSTTLDLIAAQRSVGSSIVFSTHYLDEARSLFDRIAPFDRGVLVGMDAPEALIARGASEVRTRPATK